VAPAPTVVKQAAPVAQTPTVVKQAAPVAPAPTPEQIEEKHEEEVKKE